MWLRRVLVVEDHALMRALVTSTLEHAGFAVLAVASAPAALAARADFDPDVMVTDIDLGVPPNGIDLAHLVRADAPDVAIVVLSNFPDAGTIRSDRALPDGAVYLNKASLESAKELVDAVEAALRGITPPAASSNALPDPRIAGLTAHQLDVLADIAAGWSNTEIANRRGTSLRAVEKAVSRLFTALGLANHPSTNPRVEAAAIHMGVFGVTASEDHVRRPAG